MAADNVKSASVIANDMNILKAKIAALEADLENAYQYVETLFTAHHLAAGVIGGFIVGLIAGLCL